VIIFSGDECKAGSGGKQFDFFRNQRWVSSKRSIVNRTPVVATTTGKAMEPGSEFPAQPGALEEVVAETARAASMLGSEMADIAGTIEDTTKLALSQAKHFASVGGGAAAMVKGNESIRDGARATAEAARTTRNRIEQALGVAVDSIESGLVSIGGSLGSAVDATNEIASIARQTRMVAFNARVEAARAGTEGNSFGVVAEAVRDLAEKIQSSSTTIAATLANLANTVNRLAERESTAGASGEVTGLRSAVEKALNRFREEFTDIEQRIEGVAQRAASNLEDCAKVDCSVQSMATEVIQFERAISGAAKKSEKLLGMSERLIELTASSGARTDDTPFIETAIAAASQLQELLESAVDGDQISLHDLFDERYVPIARTDPPQFMTRFVHLTDRLFTPIQENILTWSECVTFCAAVDRNGYLPTHNLKYSKPQGSDAVWNAANCRNRRLFQDRAGAAAGRNVRPFLAQTYRRDMGGGVFAIMKEVDAPISIRGRHWGNLRLAYRAG
jgi:methyl-accepting chemotaxis protein